MAPDKERSGIGLGGFRTKSVASPQQNTRIDGGIITLRYEEAVPAKPPIPVTVAPPQRAPTEKHPALRRPKSRIEETDETKRDSGLAPTTSSKARDGSVTTVDENILGVKIDFSSNLQSATSLQAPPPSTPTPQITRLDSMGSGSMSRWRKPGSRRSSTPKTPRTPTSKSTPEEFTPISTPIPTESLIDEEFLQSLSFSKRGSMMLGGKKAVNGHARTNGGRRQPSFSMLASPSIKILSDDLEKESKKVRSMYEQGTGLDWEDGKFAAMTKRANIEEPLVEEEPATSDSHLRANGHVSYQRPETAMSVRQEHELAGGIEDWEDVQGHDVDRYGFINLQRKLSRPGTPEPRPPQRVSTVLQQVSESPRKHRGFTRSPSSAANSTKGTKLAPSRKVSARSLNTVASNSSQRSTSRMRAATNRLPGNRDRRWMDEAGDMLTLPPGLADIAEDEEGGKAVEGLKKKEWERAEKWRKMAKVLKAGQDGEGMDFEFDARSPKLIERTWKGIPDRWRAAAWYSFLRTSAKKRNDSASDESIIHAFHKLQDASSADDVQIDIDVPRTINSHIMFRKRYRGGQRLLFRVLHSLSLYFPETGYVQGMASLAATLLCYYDEEKTFVMLVRMWTLRGLDKLYEPGFPGLMAALDEFHTKWLDGRPVSKQLNELSIEPTAYGTRWYLTLFNYSIPFPAQLRVWDVFMLLGDSDPSLTPTKDRPFCGGLDILHATSAALIDGTREILLDSDFENAMKVLTSWIPVKDEELLMKVTKAEWKLHRRKRV
ncbi:RabGAP/TBC [Hyaloscypha variabilis]